MLSSGKTNCDLWLEEWDRGSFPAKLIKPLILAAPMVGLFFFLFHLVKQSPYHRLSACGESAYLHEPAEWSQLPQEWSPDKDDPRGHRLQASLPLDSHIQLWLATISNPPGFFLFVFWKHLSGLCLHTSTGQTQRQTRWFIFLWHWNKSCGGRMVKGLPIRRLGKQQRNGAVIAPDYTLGLDWMGEERHCGS